MSRDSSPVVVDSRRQIAQTGIPSPHPPRALFLCMVIRVRGRWCSQGRVGAGRYKPGTINERTYRPSTSFGTSPGWFHTTAHAQYRVEWPLPREVESGWLIYRPLPLKQPWALLQLLDSEFHKAANY